MLKYLQAVVKNRIFFNLKSSVSKSELSPDAARCFYNLATSLFLSETSDLKHKYSGLLSVKSGKKKKPPMTSILNLQFTYLIHISIKRVVQRSLFLTCVAVGLFGVVALSGKASRVTFPNLLFFHLLLQNELPQTRLNLHTNISHTSASQKIQSEVTCLTKDDLTHLTEMFFLELLPFQGLFLLVFSRSSPSLRP